jgi:hypothetical protein
MEPRPDHATRPRLSRINQGRNELIDHILVSQALVQPLNTVTAEALIDAPLASIDPADPTARRNAPDL